MLHTQIQSDQPSQALAGGGFLSGVRRGFLATRPPFLLASAMPVLVGTAWASAEFHRFDGLLFGLALAATLLAHAATNVYNDVGDDQIGADQGNTGRIYPYTGGSRFIQAGLLSRRAMAELALGLCVVALFIGVALTALRGPGIIMLGIVGLALGVLYSLPGAQLSARGVGEAAVGLGLGALPVLGSVWLQTGLIDANALLICIPVSCWVTAILVINEVPDADADQRAHKRTLVVRWGAVGARAIYRSLTVIGLAASGAAIARHALPLWYGLPAVALAAFGMFAARNISMDPAQRPRLKRGIEITLAVHAAGCMILIAAILLNRFI